MKIRYDGSGNINAVCVDSSSLGGSTVVSVPDNASLLANPWKYTWDATTSSLVLRKYLTVTTTAPVVDGVPTVAANGTSTMSITITAYTPLEVVDSSATFSVALVDVAARPASAPLATVNLVAGTATVSLTSSTPKKMMLMARAAGSFNGSLAASFA